MAVDTKEFYAKDRVSWRSWLAANHSTETSIWLVFDKGTGRKLSYEAIVEEALCFGWIDSVAGTVSDTKSKIYISIRKPKGVWSKPNKERVKRLISIKQMQPAGLAAIRVAKANGAWDNLNRSDNLEIPPDLMRLFDINKTAKTNFDAFTPSSKRIILEWIYSAKRDETRVKRVTYTARLAAQNRKAYPGQ